MELATTVIGSIFGGGAAAGAGAGAAAAGATAAATTGISAASILQGAAGLLGMFAQIGAANAEAESLQLAADDAEREKPLETLEGISRRSSIKQAMMDQIGQQDVAYAASGADLSFGTPGQARKEAFREGDLALTSDAGTEQTRVARLDERAANYRKRAAKARSMGVVSALATGFDTFSSMSARGY